MTIDAVLAKIDIIPNGNPGFEAETEQLLRAMYTTTKGKEMLDGIVATARAVERNITC